MKHTKDNKTLERIANSLESIAESLKEINRKAVDNNAEWHYKPPVLTKKGEERRSEVCREALETSTLRTSFSTNKKPASAEEEIKIRQEIGNGKFL